MLNRGFPASFRVTSFIALEKRHVTRRQRGATISKFFDALCVTIPSHACKVVPEHVHMHVFSLSMQGAQNTCRILRIHSFVLPILIYQHLPIPEHTRPPPTFLVSQT
jgi:hypothetical protein